MEAIKKLQNKKSDLLNQAMEFANAGDFKNAKAKREEAEAVDVELQNAIKEYENIKTMQDNLKVTDIQNKGVVVPGGTVIDSISNITDENFTNTIEYRRAFMNYVVNGTPIAGEFKNASANTKTTDIGEMIPETVLSKIVEKMESTGMILPLVTRTSYKGGVAIPTSTVKPVATWVAEGAGSDKQKKTAGSITFSAYKLRCAISSSLEVSVMALPVFETTFINNVVEAMTKALEQAILTGTGINQPKGILTETVADGQNIDVAKADKPKLEHLENAEAALPLAYETGAVWLMTKKTFMAYASLKDSAGQPIGKVNYGIAGRPERTILGRPVILNDYMKNYVQAATEEAIVIALFNMKDYVLNTNLNMTIKKYEDNDTDDLVTKAIMLADGKVVDKNSLVTITKKNA